MTRTSPRILHSKAEIYDLRESVYCVTFLPSPKKGRKGSLR